MPVRSFALMLCGVLFAAGVTIGVAYAISGLLSAQALSVAASLVMIALLVAAALVRQIWR